MEEYLVQQDELRAEEGVEGGEEGEGQGDVQEEGQADGQSVDEDHPAHRLHD